MNLFKFFLFTSHFNFIPLISIKIPHVDKLNYNACIKLDDVGFESTNFGVWLLGYPNTIAGFISCYTLALPFFINTILGDLFFTHTLNYSFSKIENKYPSLAIAS